MEVGRNWFLGQVVDLETVEMKQVVDLDSSAPLATLAQCELNQFQDQISQPLIGIGHSMGGMQL